jgi:hypothetical protein
MMGTTGRNRGRSGRALEKEKQWLEKVGDGITE